MKLEKIIKILEAEVLVGIDAPGMEIKTGFGCDLMSDVLAFVKPDSLLLTGLTNQQVVRTAEMADIKAICFVRGKKPDAACIKLAKENKIPLFLTSMGMLESCGKLYNAGLLGCIEKK